MRKGKVLVDRKSKWYEPQHALLGDDYPWHASGSMYAVSSRAMVMLAKLPLERMRAFANEDVLMGMYALLLSLKHRNDPRMCDGDCTTAVGMFEWFKPTPDFPAKAMYEQHAACSKV